MYRVLNCLTTEHQLWLVEVAGFVCLLTCLVAINFFHRARATSGNIRASWIIAAGVTTGWGTWSTHFIAMLAYDPGIGIAYNLRLTILSLVVACLIAGSGLAVAARGQAILAVPLGGAIVGAGVASMHYVGMWAIELPGHMIFDPTLVVASMIIGVAFAVAALMVSVRHTGRSGTLAAATLLLLAIVSMHFTAMGAITIVPDPTSIVHPLAIPPSLLASGIACLAIAVLTASFTGELMDRRAREQSARITTAFEAMSQGLSMFDVSARLILANRRYLEMYGLSEDHVKPGISIQEILAARSRAGTFTGDADAYLARTFPRLRDGESADDVAELSNGKIYLVARRPIVGGGWITTHQDITEQRRQDKERQRLVAQELRRDAIEETIARFRQRVESMISTVGHHTATMRTTATTLFSSSDKTSEHAKSAVDASNQASDNVATAAAAAQEMSSSITEISRQLARTNGLVAVAVGEAGATNA